MASIYIIAIGTKQMFNEKKHDPGFSFVFEYTVHVHTVRLTILYQLFLELFLEFWLVYTWFLLPHVTDAL